MTVTELRHFADSLLKEAKLQAFSFDGTIGDGAFRNRVATLYYGVRTFKELTGVDPQMYLDTVKEPEPDGR